MCKHTCKRSFLSLFMVLIRGFLWFGCCLFLPHHMPTENHRFNPILSCSVEQILGEERKLHHVEASETMTSSYRYDFCSSDLGQTHRKLFKKSNTEAAALLCCWSPQKPAFALIFWTSSSRRLAAADPSEVKVTRC